MVPLCSAMEPTTIGAASEEEEIRLEDLVRSGRAAVDEGADDFNLAVAVLKGASEQGKLFKARASEQGKKSASASASASSSFRHRLLFSADARVATSTTPEDGKGVKDSDAEHDDENSASFQDQDEDEANSTILIAWWQEWCM